MSDPFKLISDRQSALADEINALRQRITTLEGELDELDRAATLLKKLAAKANVVEAAAITVNVEQLASRVPDLSPPAGKPAGTPQITEMIFEALGLAHKSRAPGLQPSALTTYVRQIYWPQAEIANIGPIAWRMWKRGQLGKDGPIYFRLDRESFYPHSQTNEAPSHEKEGASLDLAT
jgi:hypothetical protein